MKAKFLTIIALAAVGAMTSCNMDLPPVGSLEENTAIESVRDVKAYRNYFYTAVRAFATSDFFVYSDIQADMFNGLTINGNRMGTLANGTVLPSDGDITGYWSALYHYINNVNFFMEKAEPILKKVEEENEIEKVQQMKRYIGEARFIRAFFYAEMFDRWCQVYTPALGDQPALGLPVVTEYNPTPDRASYKGRDTMNATIKFIQEEMEAARLALMEWEEVADRNESDEWELTPMAAYLSSKAVEAMQARFALWISDYDTAIAKSTSVINSGIYALMAVDSKSTYETMCNSYKTMWKDDLSDEIIFMPFMSDDELSGSIGDAWLGVYNNQADYAPGTNFIKNLEVGYNQTLKTGDVRYATFVGVRNLSTNYGSIGTPVFTKFPGNPKLIPTGVSTPNLMNKPKVFRLAEQYLILAEAAYNKGDNTTANKALNELRKHRYMERRGFAGYDELSGNELLREIQLQRGLELVGEGFRLSDLRRWKQGFSRSVDYANIVYPGLTGVNASSINSIITPAGAAVIYSADDHRYTWPIPADEMNVNPQIKGQQNPGY